MSIVFDVCGEVFRRLDDYLDRELPEGELEAIRAHLRGCAGCAAEFRFESGWLRGVRAKLRRLARPLRS